VEAKETHHKAERHFVPFLSTPKKTNLYPIFSATLSDKLSFIFLQKKGMDGKLSNLDELIQTLQYASNIEKKNDALKKENEELQRRIQKHEDVPLSNIVVELQTDKQKLEKELSDLRATNIELRRQLGLNKHFVGCLIQFIRKKDLKVPKHLMEAINNNHL